MPASSPPSGASEPPPPAAGESVSAGGPFRLWQRFWPAISITAGVSLLCAALRVPLLGPLGIVVLSALFAVLLVGVAAALARKLLFRVGRRLAFSYFLIGVLPIPLMLMLLLVGAYLLSGFFISHLSRDAARALQRDLTTMAQLRIAPVRMGIELPPSLPTGETFGFYRDGRRIAGDERTPALWPQWLVDASLTRLSNDREALPSLVALPTGNPTIAVAATDGSVGVVAFFDGDLEEQLSRRSEVFTQLIRYDDPRITPDSTLSIFGEEFVLQPFGRAETEEALDEFFTSVDAGLGPRIVAVDLAGPLHHFGNGEIVVRSVTASLVATPRIVLRHFFGSSSKIDTLGWIAFILPAFLLFDIYAVATVMAIFLIYGLSRAIDRLSLATAAVQEGDFSQRIPVRRTDQLGALQRSFNDMTENLENLVADAADKKRLERELQVARELQQSLLPTELVQTEDVEFATYFEPSEAIGGDYFDIVRISREQASPRLAVVIADVAGHGLSAGLRMAMIKAGVTTLVQERTDPNEILASLDDLIRSGRERAAFVTATLALLDLVTGSLEITNAGHPPTYLIRNGEAREIELPGTPLGALGKELGREKLQLEPRDVLVWLSDGFIEAQNEAGELFGFERVRSILDGPCDDAQVVRDRVLDAIQGFAGSRPADDDRTLVVMHYRPDHSATAAAAS